MSQYNKTVLEVGEASKGQYTWTTITTKGKDGGKNKTENVMDKEVAKYFKEHGVGLYSITYDKNEKGFWNVVGAVRMGTSGAAEEHQKQQTEKKEPAPSTNGTSKTTQGVSPSVADVQKLRADIAMKAIEAVGLTLAAFVAKSDGNVDLMALTDHGAVLARTLMNEARDFIKGTAANGAAAQTTPAGA